MTDKTIKDFENKLYRQIQALKEALERKENIYQNGIYPLTSSI